MTYVIIGKPNCKYCDSAKKILNIHNEEYVYFEASLSPHGEAFKNFIMANNLKTVPQVWLNGHYIGGFEQLERHLNDGY
jgi:glutaredoxin